MHVEPPFGAGADMWRDSHGTGQMEHSGVLREPGFTVRYLEAWSLPQVASFLHETPPLLGSDLVHRPSLRPRYGQPIDHRPGTEVCP